MCRTGLTDPAGKRGSLNEFLIRMLCTSVAQGRALITTLLSLPSRRLLGRLRGLPQCALFVPFPVITPFLILRSTIFLLYFCFSFYYYFSVQIKSLFTPYRIFYPTHGLIKIRGFLPSQFRWLVSDTIRFSSHTKLLILQFFRSSFPNFFSPSLWASARSMAQRMDIQSFSSAP